MTSSLLKVPERAFVSLITQLAPESALSAWSVFEAGVVHMECQNPELAQHIHKLQTIFGLVNAGCIIWNLQRLTHEIQRKFAFSIGVSGGLALAIAVIPNAAGIVSYINKYFEKGRKKPAEVLKATVRIPPEIKPLVSLSWERPGSQLISQHLHLLRSTTNLALAYFASDRLCFAATALSQLYSLIKLASLKWTAFSGSYFLDVPERRFAQYYYVEQIDLSYHYLSFSHSASEKEICEMCHAEKPDSYFCTHEAYHDECLLDRIYTISCDLVLQPHRTDHLEKGLYSYTYQLSLNNATLPACLKCLIPPLHAYVTAQVKDADKGWCDTSVFIPNKLNTPLSSLLSTSLIEGIHTAFAAFQAAFAHVQYRYPEHAATFLRIRQVLLFADILACAKSYFQLVLPLKEARGKLEPDQVKWYRSRLGYYGTIALGTIATIFTAAVIGRAANEFFRPKIHLTEILKTLVSAEELQTLTVDWYVPLSQGIYASQVLLSLATAFFFKRRRFFHLSQAALHAATLFNSSQLHWITLSKIFKRPSVLSNTDLATPLWAREGHHQWMTSFTSTSNFLIPPLRAKSSCADQTAHLRSQLKTIHDSCIHQFNNSSWYRYEWVTTQGSVETNRELNYKATLPTPILDNCLCGLPPVSYGNPLVEAIDRERGRAEVMTVIANGRPEDEDILYQSTVSNIFYFIANQVVYRFFSR